MLETSVGAAKQAIFEARRSLFEFAEGRAMACDEVRKTISDADGRSLRSRRVRAHLRDCSACAEFAAAIRLAAPTCARLSRRCRPPPQLACSRAPLGAGSGHGGGGGSGRTAPPGPPGRRRAPRSPRRPLAGVVIVAVGTAGAAAGLGQISASPHKAASPAARAASAAAAGTGTGAGAQTAGAQAAGRPCHAKDRPVSIFEAAAPRPVGDARPQNRHHAPGGDLESGDRSPRRQSRAECPGAAGSPGSTTAQQQAQPTPGGSSTAQQTGGAQGGDSGRPARGSGSGAATVSVPGGTATVKVPGGSARYRCPAAAPRCHCRAPARPCRCRMAAHRFRSRAPALRLGPQWQRFGFASGRERDRFRAQRHHGLGGRHSHASPPRRGVSARTARRLGLAVAVASLNFVPDVRRAGALSQ